MTGDLSVLVLSLFSYGTAFLHLTSKASTMGFDLQVCTFPVNCTVSSNSLLVKC